MNEPLQYFAPSTPRRTATAPVPRPDRQFYAQTHAFGRFGIRWFDPRIMASEHFHGHIEINWLTSGSMDYVIDGRPLRIPAERLVLFWAGIPHQTTGLDPGAGTDSRQCNVYLPLDSFLHMPNLGPLTATMMGGGVVMLPTETIGEDTLRRWYQDYRSGDAERTDILKQEIALMLRRAAVTGWDTLMEPWIESVGASTRTASPLRYVVAMIRHILENLDEPLRAEDVARVVGLHPNYALNLFSDVMRVPLHKFVVRMRLIRARALLFEGNLSIENVAFESGFRALSQFYVQFRKAYGLTPRQMRAHYLR
ncbi:helix-turn-helix domain-containing protein [Devosia sp.]|uniref:helix-turn-helix domain-containing protein n=1 Tax=Devosia sp. TaxID=1871048 RepID=UPI001AC68B83|nr:helix-turn-helix domain-containing protein [Devosia sp.]MBN9307834.1 helix-turn-helix domain-containing protein [Devosia sp.]